MKISIAAPSTVVLMAYPGQTLAIKTGRTDIFRNIKSIDLGIFSVPDPRILEAMQTYKGEN